MFHIQEILGETYMITPCLNDEGLGGSKMTGKDLVMYILSNNLENEPLEKDGRFIGLVTDEEVATKLGVGLYSVHTMVDLKILPGVKIGETVYILGDYDKVLREN